jgi:NAD-dependent deacetylase
VADAACLDILVDRLRHARRVTVLTGAGVSAASGIPTFRGAGGLWRNFRASDLATADAFARDPETVWQWYAWRREEIARAQPNAAHAVLARWTQRHEGWRVITQNVDDLHLRAGTRGLVRMHGSIWELACWARCGGTPARWRDEAVPLREMPPRCPHCGALARPGVVWFGEALDPAVLREAESLTQCDVFIAAGTSAQVYPAAGFVPIAAERGAFVVEMNIESTAASADVDLVVTAPVEQALADVDRRLG